MATVAARPRNNLQQQLSWFLTEKPQIPARDDRVDYTRTSSDRTILLEGQAKQPLQPLQTAQSRFASVPGPQRDSGMPNPGSMRSTSFVAPQRSEVVQSRKDTFARSKSATDVIPNTTNASLVTGQEVTQSRISCHSLR